MPKERLIISREALFKQDATRDYLNRVSRNTILGLDTWHNRRADKKLRLEAKVERRIEKQSMYLIDKLFELADGVFMVERDKIDAEGNTKELKYYKTRPDLQAIQYLLDRIFGKPTQRTEHKSENKGVMVIEHILKNIAEQKPHAIEAYNRAIGQERQYDGEGEDGGNSKEMESEKNS